MARPSIRRKIILYTVVPVTLLYNLLSALHIYTFFQESSEEIEAQMHNNVVHFARSIDAHGQHIVALGRAQSQLLRLDSEAVYPILKDLVSANPFLLSASWYALDSSQPVVCASRIMDRVEPCQTLAFPPSESGVSQWTEMIRADPYWTALYRDASTGKQFISYLVSVQEQGMTRLLKLDVDIYTIVQSVINRSLFTGRYIGINLWKFNLVDRDGYYLYTDSIQAKRHRHRNLKETGRVYGVEGFGENIAELIDAGEPASSRIWIPNPEYRREYWVFGAPVHSLNWWLYTSVSRQHALKGALDVALADTFIMLVSLLLILWGIWYSSKRITQPLIQLKACMDRFIEHRRLIDMPETNTSDETDSLTRSFSKLALWLDHRDKALQVARANNMGHIVQSLKGRYFYFQLDARGNIVYISPSIESVLGYSRQEFSRPFGEYLSSDPGNRCFTPNFQKVLDGDWVDAFELEVMHKYDGNRRLEVFWTAMEQGQQQSVLEGLANDVTERVSDTLKFKALLNSAPDATVILNPDGIIVMANSRAVDLLGYQSEELINMPIAIMVPHPFRNVHPLLLPLREKAWNKTALYRIETDAVDCSGRLFPAELTSNPLVTTDGVLISVVIRDVTERRQIEKALKTAHDEAIMASRAKSLFLSCMSHELRTPLNGIIGYAQVLQRSAGLEPGQYQKLSILERCGLQLLNLINDILDLSKIESQGVNLHPVSVNLPLLLQETLDLLTPKAASKGLRLKLKTAGHLPEWVMVDEVKLRQVLTNLLGNAVKYTESGQICLSLDVRDSSLNFAVQDSGIGIKRENLDVIFDPFRQLDEGLKAGGAGLGLAICRRLVTAMGGELKVSSDVGVGSCFSFSLPVVLAQAVTPAKAYSREQIQLELPKHYSYTVLVVDDLEINRDLLRVILEEAGFRVFESCSGIEALDWLKKQLPDLVLMDIRMPGMSGSEALQCIRANPKLRPLRVVAVTASAGSDIKDRLMRQGFDGVLAKPFKVNYLLQLIADLLQLRMEVKQTLLPQPCQDELPELDNELKEKLVARLTRIMELGDIQALPSITLGMEQPELDAYCKYLTRIAEACDMDELEKFRKTLTPAAVSTVD